MKKYIKKISIYITLIISIIIIVLSLTYVINKNRFSNLITNEKVIIMGDSHPKCAIDPDLIKNSINLSEHSESYLFTYYKLKNYLKYNSEVETLILGFGFHNIFHENEKINSKNNSLNSSYFLLLDFYGIRKYCHNNPIIILKKLTQILVFQTKEQIQFANQNHQILKNINPWGGYYNSSKNNINDSIVKIAIQRHYNDTSISTTQIEQLIRIINLCKVNNIKLHLVNTPLHESYVRKIPEHYIKSYYTVCNDLKLNNYLIDTHKDEFNDNEFGDGDHLNSRGAIKYTYLIHNIIVSKN